jgi:hypothetical protein
LSLAPPLVGQAVGHPAWATTRADDLVGRDADELFANLFVTWPGMTGCQQSEYTDGDDGCAYGVTTHGAIQSEAESLAEAAELVKAYTAGPRKLLLRAEEAQPHLGGFQPLDAPVWCLPIHQPDPLPALLP